jgi:hypothetical protein
MIRLINGDEKVHITGVVFIEPELEHIFTDIAFCKFFDNCFRNNAIEAPNQTCKMYMTKVKFIFSTGNEYYCDSVGMSDKEISLCIHSLAKIPGDYHPTHFFRFKEKLPEKLHLLIKRNLEIAKKNRPSTMN